MNLYSISELEQFSGIKPHTIRIWEKRYNALKPQRSTGNTRYYDNYQLKRLLNIVSLSESGYKISELSKMPDKGLFKLIETSIKNTATAEPYEYYVSQMIIASINYDEHALEKIFSHCQYNFGLTVTYEKIIYPLLLRVGLMWGNDTIRVAQEHFLANMIRQKIYKAIDLLPEPNSSKGAWLLFLPEKEYHDIGLLFANYLIRLSGKKVFYLGSSVPFNSLKNAVRETGAENIFFFLVHNNPLDIAQKYIDNVCKNFGKCNIHLAGNHKLISSLKIKKQVNWIQSVAQLNQQLIH